MSGQARNGLAEKGRVTQMTTANGQSALSDPGLKSTELHHLNQQVASKKTARPRLNCTHTAQQCSPL